MVVPAVFSACSSYPNTVGSCSILEIAEEACSGSTVYACTWMGWADYCWLKTETCDSYHKCVSGVNGGCNPKTCSELGYSYSCTGLDPTKCISGNPYECKTFGDTKCYSSLGTCSSSQTCVDPWGTTGAHCECSVTNTTASYKCDSAGEGGDVYYYDNCGGKQSKKSECGSSGYGAAYCSGRDIYKDYYGRGCSSSSNSCYETPTPVIQLTCADYEYCSSAACYFGSISSVSWSKSSVYENESVTLTANVSNIANGVKIKFVIFENDVLFDDILDTKYANVSGGKATVSFTVPDLSDGWGSPEIAFTAYVDDKTSINRTSSDLSVNQSCSGTTGSKRCYGGLVGIETQYYNNDCSTYWVSSTNCSSSDYCLALTNTCVSRKADGVVCSIPGQSTRECSSNTCNMSGVCGLDSVCTQGQTRCNGEMTKETCAGGQWTPQSVTYCLQGTNGASVVECLRDSHCSSGKSCQNNACVTQGFCTENSTRCNGETVKETCIGNQWAQQSVMYCLSTFAGATVVECLRDSHCSSGKTCQNNSCKVPSSCVSGQTQCNGETVKETCVSGQWAKQSVNYCLQGTNGASVVECLRDSHCSSEKKCESNFCTAQAPVGECNIKEVTWSKSSAVQWDPLDLTVKTENCANGEIVTFKIWEYDLFFPDDFVMSLTAPISSNTAKVSWNAIYIEDQYMRPEFVFKATVGSHTKTSKKLIVEPSLDASNFSEIDNIAKSDPIVIVYFDSASGEANKTINDLAFLIDLKNQFPVLLKKSSEFSSCWDYQNLKSTLILVGYDSSNKAIECLLDSQGRAKKDSDAQLSIYENPWVVGKSVVVVHADNEVYDAILALKLMIQKGANPALKKRDLVVGCFVARDGGFVYEMVCNVVPIAEIIFDIRDSFRCVRDHPLSLVPQLSFLTNDDLVEIIFCDIVYGAFAYDVIGYSAVVGTVVTVPAATPVTFAAEEGADAAIAFFKSTFKVAVRSLDRGLIEAGYKTIKNSPDLIRKLSLFVAKNPDADEAVAKSLYKMLAAGEKTADSGFSYLNKNKVALSTLGKSAAIDATTALFKVEGDTGIKIVVSTAEKNAIIPLKIAENGRLSEKILSTAEDLGIDPKSIPEIRFADVLIDNEAFVIEDSKGILGITLNSGIVQISTNPSKVMTATEFVESQLKNTLPHEIIHSTLTKKGIKFTGSAGVQTEELIVDKIARSKLKGVNVLDYETYEKLALKKGHFDIIEGDEDYWLAFAAQNYKKAEIYDVLEAKLLIHYSVTAHIQKIFPEYIGDYGKIQKAFDKFVKYSDELDASATKYIETGVFNPPTKFSFTFEINPVTKSVAESRNIVTNVNPDLVSGQGTDTIIKTIKVPKNSVVKGISVEIRGGME